MEHATLADLTGTVQEVQDELRDRYKATTVRVTTVDDDADAVDVRLEFRGFEDLGVALTRIRNVALELEHNHDADVTAGVDGSGLDYPDEDDPDQRPAGWVSATLETQEG